MTAEKQDIETIIPDEAKLTLDGVKVRVKRIRMRETLSLARILAGGLGGGLLDLSADDLEDMKGQILGLLVIALPNAIEETLQFFQQVLEPVNETDRQALAQALLNPDLAEIFDVVEVLIEQEADNLFEIVGKAQAVGRSVAKAMESHRAKKGPTDG